MLLGLFLQIEDNPYVSELIRNTLSSWIADPKSAEHTKSLVFDYEDYFLFCCRFKSLLVYRNTNFEI